MLGIEGPFVKKKKHIIASSYCYRPLLCPEVCLG